MRAIHTCVSDGVVGLVGETLVDSCRLDGGRVCKELEKYGACRVWPRSDWTCAVDAA